MRTLLIVLMLFVARVVHGDDDPGRVRFGAQVAFGNEQGYLFGSGESSRTQLVMLQPQLSVALLHSAGRPQVEFVTEYTAARSLRPLKEFLHFMNVGGRFHVFPRRSTGVYAELGAGMGNSNLVTDPSDPNPRSNPVFRQLTGHMQYHLQVGGGLRMDIGAGRLHVGCRITHLSNNSIELPNLGLNLFTVVVGYQTRPF